MPRLIAMVVLVAALAAGTVSGTQRAAADTTQPSTYTDPTGDAATAPDVSNVTMTPGSGTVRVDITFTGALGTDGDILFVIDADRNTATGSSGFDYALELAGDGYAYAKWNGSQWDTFAHQDIAASLSDTHVGFTLTLADLGGVSTFDWGIESSRGTDHDDVPDGTGLATYPLVVATPTVKAVLLPAVVLTARAGKTLRIPTLQVTLSDSTIATVDSQTCTLMWKGKRIPSTGSCAFAIPKKAKGQRLALKVTYVYAGKSHVVAWTIIPH